MRRILRHALIALIVAAAVAPATVARAVSTGDLSIQSVDTSAWPKVTLNVLLPPEMLTAGALHAGGFAVVENGAPVKVDAVSGPSSARRPFHVVLVLDTSGSMKGKPLADAQDAARAFVGAMSPGDEVAIVAFSDHPTVIQPFSSDQAALTSAVDRVTAGGGTALWDALLLAASQFRGDASGDRAIVALSDGADTASAANPNSVAAALATTGVPLHAVAVESRDYDPAALGSLAKASGGRMSSVTDSAGLSALFTGIARQLSSPYSVTYTSPRPAAAQLEIEVIATSNNMRAGVTVVRANPSFESVRDSAAAVGPPPSPAWPMLVAVLVFLAAAGLVAGLIVLLRPEPNAMQQLRYYEQIRGDSTKGHSEAEAVVDPRSARGRLMSVVGSVAARRGFDAVLRGELERAGLPLRPVEYMTLHVSTVLVLSFLTAALGGGLVLSGVVVLASAFGPIVLLLYLGRRRSAAFETQLPDVLNMLAGSLRAGWGLVQAMGMVVSEMGAPASPEFNRVVTEARLGIPLEEALSKMSDRLRSTDFQWVVTAISIQREVGGNLAEVLDIVADTVRERAGLRRQVSALTSEGRVSAWILIGLPIIEGIALYYVNPSYMGALLNNAIGLALMALAVVLLGLGALWLRAIVNIEV